MNLVRSRKQAVSWLLALLLSSSAWGMLLPRGRQSGAGCAGAAHACCCCRRSGLAHCCCAGRSGAAAQLASLAACPGTGGIPAVLPVLPPTLLPPASAVLPPLPDTSIVRATAPAALLSVSSQPPTPPPQVA